MLSKIKSLNTADWLFIIAFDAAVLYLGFKWGRGDFKKGK